MRKWPPAAIYEFCYVARAPYHGEFIIALCEEHKKQLKLLDTMTLIKVADRSILPCDQCVLDDFRGDKVVGRGKMGRRK
jgi:hypothetical protein